MRKIHEIKRKGRNVFVLKYTVGELDKNKFSRRFLKYNFDDNKVVFVKCFENGKLDLRGKKEEYRILNPDKE